MSPAASSTGRNMEQQPHQRLLDQAAILDERERASGDQSLNRGAERTGVETQSVELRREVVEKLMKEHPELVPMHLQGNPEKLSAFLLEKRLEQQREALTALNKTQEGAKEAKKEGWLSSAFNTVRSGISAVGGHLSRHWGKYLVLAAALGVGWYYSDYILAWMKQLQGLVTQGAIDTGASQVVSTAPTTVPGVEGANLTTLIANNPLGPTTGYPATIQPPISNFFTGGTSTLPVTPDINAAAQGLLK